MQKCITISGNMNACIEYILITDNINVHLIQISPEQYWSIYSNACIRMLLVQFQESCDLINMQYVEVFTTDHIDA